MMTNIATIIVALIAGMIALFQVKSNIISNARVKWIENLRDTLSDYISKLEDCSHAKGRLLYEIQNNSKEEIDLILEKFRPPYSLLSTEVLKLQSKAFLYLNSSNPKHKQIEELLRKNSLLLHQKGSDNHEFILRNIEQIIFVSKDIFREEWKKSKTVFRI